MMTVLFQLHVAFKELKSGMEREICFRVVCAIIRVMVAASRWGEGGQRPI
jgi:hypothetical protein